MAGKIDSLSGKISWIKTCSQISRKGSYWENLLLFWMTLNKASAYLANNIYSIKNSPKNNHLFIVNNSYARKRCVICSKLTLKTQEWRSTVFIVNFEDIFTPFSSVSIVDFKQVIVCWVPSNQFRNVKITYCTKALVKWQLIKKGLWSEVVVPKKNIFFCSLLCLIVGNSFFQSTVFCYFTKVDLAIHHSMDAVFILEEHLHPWIMYIQCIWQIFLFK